MNFDFSNLTIGKKYTRPELAKFFGYQGYQAIARGVITPSGQKTIILFVTKIKQGFFTQFNDFINGNILHWEGENKHQNDERIANAHKNGESIYLFYRELHHTPFEFRGEIKINSAVRKKDKPSEFTFYIMHDLSIIDDIQTHQHEFDFVEKTERETLIKARIGQGRFREDVFNIWKGCAITGIKDPDLLIASHIKPWRLCTNNERLDAANGLMLLPHYDHLFDKGYLSFENNGNIIFSEILTHLPIEKIGINKNDKLVRRLNSQYLEFHRDEIFIRKHKFY